jgi:hypothetical protein
MVTAVSEALERQGDYPEGRGDRQLASLPQPTGGWRSMQQSARRGWLFPFTDMMAPMIDILRRGAGVLSQGQFNPLA